ncbi:MAG: 2Fe-2S iron-sulfur cluster binding domain-containing protein [Rhodocyclaceae bacterium]|nr:MAG: 2Fe-2S iron-sulfur cluster binding domain-containing protein [Rhodocyclaceae bacterium]
MRYTVTLAETGETYPCGETENLLEGMLRLGKKGIPVGCRGGGCGVCKIEVVSGNITTKVMSRDHVSEEDQAAGRVLACRAFPASDITLRVIGLMKKNVCRTKTQALAA